ncbi:hypothetical protein acdb102_07780 [Acidothermaceae bacterium B102]|nr:hypothetical protein acdb102_07780 [Acidothermaceae bacterium B102]
MSRQRDPKLRASDADRDAVAEQLREHFATGRLRMDELNERLDKVYAAQTYGDLEPLVDDLPGPGPYSDLPVPFPANGTSPVPFEHGWGGDLTHGGPAWGAWGSASVICWGIWLASAISGGSVAGFWPVWVTVPWGGVLLAQAIGDRADRDRNDHRRRRLE